MPDLRTSKLPEPSQVLPAGMAEDAKAILDLADSSSSSEPRFTKRDYLWLNDQNMGSYTSQIQYDTQSTANNNQYVIWSDAYLEIPMTITTSAGTLNTTPGALAVCFKQPGFAALINSVLITLNGVTVNNQATNLAQLIGYRLSIDQSVTKQAQIGATLGNFTDTSDSYQVLSSGANAGISFPNNIVTEQTSNNAAIGTATWATSHTAISTNFAASGVNFNSAVTPVAYPGFVNKGALQRAKALASNWNVLAAPAATNVGGITCAAQLGRNTVAITAGTGSVLGRATYTVYAVIRLRDLHACFAAMTMPIRNLRVQIQLNLNGPIGGTMQGTSNPLMLTDQATWGTAPYVNITAGTATGIVAASIAIGLAGNQATRLYFPTVQMPASIERSLVSWKRLVTYWDHQQFYASNAAASGQQVNWLVTNGIQNLRRILLIPFVAAASTTAGTSPVLSYTSTEPGTASPCTQLTAVQLMINGKNFYANPVNYNYEQFIHEGLTEVMGGFSEDAVVSGLQSQYDWAQAPYYVFNVSRNPDIATSEVPCSIQFVAQNASQFTIDLLCLVEYESAFELDQSSSSLNVTMSRPPILPS